MPCYSNRFSSSFLQVEIFADTAEGYMSIETSGGNGKNGQNGANGRKGADSLGKVLNYHTTRIDMAKTSPLYDKGLENDDGVRGGQRREGGGWFSVIMDHVKWR